MTTATITIQIGDADAPLIGMAAWDELGRIVDIINDEAYVLTAEIDR